MQATTNGPVVCDGVDPTGGTMEHHDVLAAAEQRHGFTEVTVLAQGGQKLVAAARLGNTPVVIKSVLIAAGTDPHALERCEREVSLLRDLSHPGVVRVLSDLNVIGDPPEAAYWVEEYLDGRDLLDFLQTRWSWAQVEQMLRELASGLEAIHAESAVHRDLSAKNVRLTTAGQWKILDPGLAKHLDRSSITGLFTVGTPGFMSPEQATTGVRVTPASDIFGLGILAYLALTGELPVPVGSNMMDYRTRLLYSSPPLITPKRPDLEPWQARVVDQCLDRQPGRRFLDATELLEELNKGGRN